LVIVRKGGAGARQRAAASRKAGHADVPRPALASIVAPAEAASPPAQRAPPAPPAQAPRAQLAAQSDEVLRAIHAELGELKNGLGLQLGQQLQRVLDEIRAERREAREEEARRGADAAAAAAPSADARAHAFARAHGSPPPVQLPPSRLGSAPPSAYQSAANSLAPSPAPRATPQSAASAAESARGAARGGAREPSTAAGSRPHTSPLVRPPLPPECVRARVLPFTRAHQTLTRTSPCTRTPPRPATNTLCWLIAARQGQPNQPGVFTAPRQRARRRRAVPSERAIAPALGAAVRADRADARAVYRRGQLGGGAHARAHR
jgi:hypothetical protein